MRSLGNPSVRAPVWAALACTLSVVGCGSKPSAPAIQDSAVYENNQEGLTFLVPKGWSCSASATLPAAIEGEMVLAQWRMSSPEQGASVEILCFDDVQQSDLQKYHEQASHAVEKWTASQEPEKLQIHGVDATRHAYTGLMNRSEMTKEVVCFRRGNRVFSFIGLFVVEDEKAQQQLRRAVGSTRWTD